MSFLFVPYEMERVPNLLANIDLTDPNASLEMLYGPPVVVPSGIAGQSPAIIRYGSQAIRTTHQQPIVINHQKVESKSSPLSSPPSFGSDNPPDYEPPAYSFETGNKPTSVSQFNEKKLNN